MRIQKCVILLACCLLTCSSVFAQRPRNNNKSKSMYTRERYNSSAPRVKGSKARIVCPIFETSKFPYHGIGVKVGDPLAVTYKFYPNAKFGFVVDAGKAASGLYNRYYIRKFDDYTGDASQDTITYLSHRVNADFVGEVKIVYHLDAKALSPGLRAYAGIGWEWKKTQLQYSFTYDTSPSSGGGVRNEIDHLSRSRFTYGPQVVFGIEYSYFHIPISAFMEIEYFQDVLADPGWRTMEGGVGIRYIF
jgi:hypothetical protein